MQPAGIVSVSISLSLALHRDASRSTVVVGKWKVIHVIAVATRNLMYSI